FVLALLLAAQETGAQEKFLMGYSSFSANQTPIWVAKEEGLFKRYGTEPDLILIEGGTRGAQALISGDLPMMGMSGQPVISARARGSDLVMIAGTVNKMNYVLVGSPTVKKPDDLRGKRIGAAQAGTASYHAVLLGLKHWGLDPRRDRITILQLGNQGARVASLQSGGSDAIIVNPGLGPSLTERGNNIIADFTELPIPYPQQTVSVRERTLKSDPEFVEKVMKGVVAGNSFSLEPRNKERVKQILAKYLRLERVAQAEEHYQAALKVMAPKPYVDVAGINSMIEFITETDPLVAKVKPEMVINHTILKKLDDSGFIEQAIKR
ncbi:MAG TPA: ABC transporter substrate-binding protein, partial [Candidatus Binatia bacterium]